MLDRLRARARALADRLRRLERREVREFRRWLEVTDTLVHLSVLVFAPVLVAAVTLLVEAVPRLSFLVFPPLASGTYTLFVDPEGKYSEPGRFVAGLTIGAVCGLGALAVSEAAWLPFAGMGSDALAAALAVCATGVITWPLTIEEPSAYSTSLLALLVRPEQRLLFVGSVLLASSLVAVVFAVWRDRFYEQRATFLYESTTGDDRVLVPMRGENAGETAMLGARLAAAHEASKVVLLDVVADPESAAAERALLRETIQVDIFSEAGRSGESEPSQHSRSLYSDGGTPPAEPTADPDLRAQVNWLETHADRIQTRTGVPCQVIVASAEGDPAATTVEAARTASCDLVCIPYESEHGALSGYIRRLFDCDRDVLVHRSRSDRTRWKQVLVPVRSASDVAHNMVDFATRLAGGSGGVSVGTCIGERASRRRAEEMLADLVEPFEGAIETRVARAGILEFLSSNAESYDLVVVGASRDRSAASRFVSPPTFERLDDIETDVAIVDRGR